MKKLFISQPMRGKTDAMIKADIAYFASGWKDARGCKIEHTCALEYGIVCIEE